MNLLRCSLAPHSITWACCACLAIVTLAVDGNPVRASPSPTRISAVASIPATAPLLAGFWDKIRGDRRRMVQVGIIAVCVGFFLLSWSRK